MSTDKTQALRPFVPTVYEGSDRPARTRSFAAPKPAPAAAVSVTVAPGDVAQGAAVALSIAVLAGAVLGVVLSVA